MMDSDDDSSTNGDYDLSLMSREWDKIMKSRYNSGFIDGSAAGQNEALQQGFNAGFKQGYLSNCILSKIRGILSALLAYQLSYEGHPISDATILESHSLLEEIDMLEANAVAEEFIKLSLHQNDVRNCPTDLLQSLASSSLTPSNDQNAATAPPAENDAPASGLNLDVVNCLTIEKVNEMLMQCTPIMNSVNRCKRILKSLNWTDDMIDNLL